MRGNSHCSASVRWFGISVNLQLEKLIVTTLSEKVFADEAETQT